MVATAVHINDTMPTLGLDMVNQLMKLTHFVRNCGIVTDALRRQLINVRRIKPTSGISRRVVSMVELLFVVSPYSSKIDST